MYKTKRASFDGLASSLNELSRKSINNRSNNVYNIGEYFGTTIAARGGCIVGKGDLSPFWLVCTIFVVIIFVFKEFKIDSDYIKKKCCYRN